MQTQIKKVKFIKNDQGCFRQNKAKGNSRKIKIKKTKIGLTRD